MSFIGTGANRLGLSQAQDLAHGKPNASGRGRKLSLRPLHVRPTKQQVRRQANGHFKRCAWDGPLVCQFSLQSCRFLAQQDSEAMDGLFERDFKRWHL